MTDHRITQCMHGVVFSQCRCPAPNKRVITVACSEPCNSAGVHAYVACEVDTPTPVYSEHEKLEAVSAMTQAAADFIEWLSDTHGIMLAENRTFEEEWNGHTITATRFVPTFATLKALLAQWQNIDLDRLEDEKIAMLKALRNSNVRRLQAPTS
jgi:hypothetical protein